MHICREIYIVNNFKIKLLLDINIITLERIIFNLDIKQFTINNCRELIISLDIIAQDNIRIRQIIKFENNIIIVVKSIVIIFVYLN